MQFASARARARTATVMVAGVAVLAMTACTSSGGTGAAAPTSRTTNSSTSSSTSSSGGTSVSSGAYGSSATATPTLPPKQRAATTPVPPPSQGNINQTVAPTKVITKKPVKIGRQANFGGKVTAKITSTKLVQSTAKLPGEVSGRSVRVQVRVRNGSAKAISLGNVVVTVVDANKTPLVQLTSSTTGLSGALASGRSATGIYTFEFRGGHPNPLTFSVSYQAGAPIVRFIGRV